MTPKRYLDILKSAIADTEDPEFIEALIVFYWKTVRKEIAEINKTRIEMHGLGCFDLKYFKVKYKLRDTKAFIRYHEKKNTPRSLGILQNLNRKLEVLERANTLSEKRANGIVEKRSERKKYILKNSSGLEESEENFRGDSQHAV